MDISGLPPGDGGEGWTQGHALDVRSQLIDSEYLLGQRALELNSNNFAAWGGERASQFCFLFNTHTRARTLDVLARGGASVHMRTGDCDLLDVRVFGCVGGGGRRVKCDTRSRTHARINTIPQKIRITLQ